MTWKTLHCVTNIDVCNDCEISAGSVQCLKLPVLQQKNYILAAKDKFKVQQDLRGAR